MIYREISHESLVFLFYFIFSIYVLGEHVYHVTIKWDIPWFTTRECSITILYHALGTTLASTMGRLVTLIRSIEYVMLAFLWLAVFSPAIAWKALNWSLKLIAHFTVPWSVVSPLNRSEAIELTLLWCRPCYVSSINHSDIMLTSYKSQSVTRSMIINPNLDHMQKNDEFFDRPLSIY